jgi:hypothetical protein
MIVTVLALVFTVAAFWWVFLRPGTITSAAPDTYATPPGPTLRLRFPFVLLNTGAIPVVVADLRLIVEGVHEFHWSSVRKKIAPSMDDFLDAAAPFAVKGRDAVQVFAEFGQVPPEWRPEPGKSYPVKLEAKDQTGRWKQVIEFEWWSPVRDDQLNATVAHRNASAGGPLL